MKIRHLLIGMLAIAGAVACNQDQPVEEPILEVNKTNVAVAATAGEGAFEVTANNAWTAAADADWVSLDPASGDGGETAVAVKVTAEDNTAAEVRTATVTVKAGTLTKTLKVTQAAAATGEDPGTGDEPTPSEVSWGMMGCFVDNQWATDVPMTKEGEWIVAKGAQFTELTFKIRGNASWADATNIGRAPGSERAVVNGRIEVVTAEYAKANLGGDAADIKLNGEPGTYDVYFSFENLEVYVMEEGFKPGEKEPQNPDPVEITYTVVGTIADAAWVNNVPAGLMTKEGDLYIAKNVPFVWNSTCYGGDYNRIEFKILETGTWDGFAYPEKNVDQYANAEITVQIGGENIALNAPEGSYDVYFDKANLKVWVMEAGFKPGEKEPLIPEEPEDPEQPEPEYTLDGKQWYVNAMGTDVLVDLGLYEEDAMVIALPAMDGSGFACHMYGAYEIEKADAKSGNIIFTQYDPEWDEFMDPVAYPYSELSEGVVRISMENVLGDASPFLFVAVQEPYEIMFDNLGGGDGPSGAIEDGEYWFIEPTNQKVMTPLGETQNYGRMSAADAINGASTAKNAFTFTYNPDWSCYTIQDSYGRYLYSSMQSDGVTPYRTMSVADNTPAADDENLAYYMWTVYDNENGTYDVYNCATYYSISYSAAYNNWEIYDPYEDDFSNLYPSLVKADNPVEEPKPEEPSEVKTLTNAEICAAMTSSSNSYADYTIESESGTWTVNASQNQDNTFLQCRGHKGSYIKTPEFDKDIKSVTIHFSSAKSVYSGNTYCAFPSTWTPTQEDKVAYLETGNVGKAVTDGSYSLTIPVNAGNKQVCIAMTGGTYAYYLDHIEVAF